MDSLCKRRISDRFKGDKMKGKNKILTSVLLFISLFLPVISLILYCFGYTVTLVSYTVFSIVSALIFIVSAYLISKTEQFNRKKTLRFFMALLPLFSLINAFVYVFKSKSVVVLICMSISFVCSAVVAEKICNHKIASVLTSMVLSLPLLVVSFAVVFFGDFGANTVVDRIYSPEKTYYAEIVDNDQGALGGDTIVYACKNSKLNLLVLTISKTPQRVYVGDWREYETMQITWKNENCLLIDSEEYIID